MILLDTSAVLRLFEAKHRDVLAIVAAAGEKFAVSMVTVGELHRGVLAAADDPSRVLRERTLHRVLQHGDQLPVTDLVAEHWGRMAVVAARKVGANDLWIAATAAAFELTLVTSDHRLASAADGLGVTDVRLINA